MTTPYPVKAVSFVRLQAAVTATVAAVCGALWISGLPDIGRTDADGAPLDPYGFERIVGVGALCLGLVTVLLCVAERELRCGRSPARLVTIECLTLLPLAVWAITGAFILLLTPGPLLWGVLGVVAVWHAVSEEPGTPAARRSGRRAGGPRTQVE